jgi:ATP-binding cassette subfamily G (WHITE) protein 2
MNQVFSNMSAVDLFIQRKALFIHENASGYYRVSVFFFSQVVTDLIAKRIAPVLLFSVITYFMLDLDREPEKFFIFLLTLFLVSISAAAITYAFSSIANVTPVATLLSALAFVLSMLFGGFFIALKSLPVWLRWLKYLSLFRYGLEALSINELRGREFYAEGFNSSSPCMKPYCISGTEALSGLGYETEGVWVWYDQIALAGISLFFLTLCCVILQLIKKHK